MTDISVDTDFVRFGSKSYATSKINSIEVRASRPYHSNNWVGVALIATCLLIAAMNRLNLGLATLGLLTAAVALFLWARTRIVEYQLFLQLSSGEVQVFGSPDPDHVFALQDEIEAAIACRSRPHPYHPGGGPYRTVEGTLLQFRIT